MKVPSIRFVVLVACAAVAARLLEDFGISRDVSAAIGLALFFAGWLAYRHFVQKERLGRGELILAAPICLILTLVILVEAGLLGVPRTAIWIAFAVASILALGYAVRSDDRPDTV